MEWNWNWNGMFAGWEMGCVSGINEIEHLMGFGGVIARV